MIKEAEDFLDESDALDAILSGASNDTLSIVTQFKSWTIEDVIAHLYMWNHAAELSLQSREGFQLFFADIAKSFVSGKSHPVTQRHWLDGTRNGLAGEALLAGWRDHYPSLADAYRNADPELRLAWAGPDMNARACIVARQMETWAHGQEVFDILGLKRTDKDRIRNICHLGVTTYSWTFRNRGDDPPLPKPYVRLTAPSGDIWEWNSPQEANAVSGPASDFAQVVTQTRNISDTRLETAGKTAALWMATAQCFAGAPETPPGKGLRRRTAN